MKKILYLQGHARYTREWGVLGEVIQTLRENPENDIYYMDCDNTFSGFCWLSQNYHLGYCKKCLNGCHQVLEHLNFPKEKILKIEKVKIPKIPNFSSIKEALQYEKDGYHIAFGAINCLMTAFRDYAFDITKYQKLISKFIYVEYTTLKNLERFYDKYKFDEIHTFNGRFSLNHPLVEFAQKKEIPFTTYEFGSNIGKYRIDTNNVPHDFYYLKSLISNYWKNAPSNKDEIAKKWFEERRAGKFQAMESFTKEQITNALPKGFNKHVENIAMFNSSTDEMAPFASWKQPFFEKDNEVIDAILNHYKDDLSKHFYLRVHPNLAKAKKCKSTQMQEIEKLKKKYPANLTVIEPDEKIDTYALVDNVNKVITFGSSVGCEATYWGAVSILAGKALHEDCNCAYNANSYQELYELIDRKDLCPKPRSTSFPYGYYNQIYGTDYKYFKINTLKDGELLGLKIKG